jgi:glycoside/pentoside/hexuronide:cation symporter, GPH family
MNDNLNPTRLPLKVIWIYAMGQLGWSLASYGISSLLPYFYMPPETRGQSNIFPTFIPQTAVFGITLLGLISGGGRLFDALIDPYIANISDKSKSKFGKRRVFMGMAAGPLAVFSWLSFFPITSEPSSLNVAWLTICIFLYYIFLAMYFVPYAALIGELGQNSEDRLRISMVISITWALGFLMGSTTIGIQSFFEKSMPAILAFKVTTGIFTCLALVFLLIPVIFLDENRYARQGNTNENFFDSIKIVLTNQNFKYFAIANLLYWLSLSFIQIGIAYYVTILFGLDKSMATLFGVISFFASFLFYPMMGFLQQKWGKKNILLMAFLTFCIIFGITLLPFSGIILFYTVSLLAAFPLACFGILPSTMVADMVEAHENETNQAMSGMFFASTALSMKLGISLANLLFPSLLLFGKSTEKPLGVQLSIVAALIFCFLGYLVFRNYNLNSTPKSI